MPTDDPSTQELKRQQVRQERAERDRIPESVTEAEADRHERRAEKAGYLREKLEERERSEREAGVADEPGRSGVPDADAG